MKAFSQHPCLRLMVMALVAGAVVWGTAPSAGAQDLRSLPVIVIGGTATDDAAHTTRSESALSLVTVTVNLNETHQTIDGFGVAQPGGDQNQIPRQDSAPWLFTYPEPFRSHIMDLAFSEVKGIGLTILRMRVEGMMELPRASGTMWIQPKRG